MSHWPNELPAKRIRLLKQALPAGRFPQRSDAGDRDRTRTLADCLHELYGIAPEKLDAMMLTHGHYDHFGGMVGFLAKHESRLKPGIPFYVGGEAAFCTRALLHRDPLCLQRLMVELTQRGLGDETV
jgi:phosphoribosyl 1,2-cyclic phosphodiesterase